MSLPLESSLPLLLAMTSLVVAVCSADRAPSSAARFAFSGLAAAAVTVPADQLTAELPDVGECTCRLSCLGDPDCRGYGFSDARRTCRRTSALPEAAATKPDPDTWRWFSRLAPRWLGEPCHVGAGCDSPNSICLDGVCRCRPPRELSADGTACNKTGSFVSVSADRLGSSRVLDDVSAATVADCRSACAGNVSCVAVAFSNQRCTLYAEGVTRQAGPSDGRRAFVWRFPRPDGVPPDSYTLSAGGRWLALKPRVTMIQGPNRCALDDAIPFPPASKEAVDDALSTVLISSYVTVGVERGVDNDGFVLSDDSAADSVPWGGVNPPSPSYTCGSLTPTGVQLVLCHSGLPLLCQFVGENLALRKTSWMNDPLTPNETVQANDGNAGNLASTSTSKTFPETSWTVDLGDVYQVTAVLLATGPCHVENQPGTEVLVGSHPNNFDDAHASVCVYLRKRYGRVNYTRLFHCPLPLTGRFVRVRRHNKVLEIGDIAVYGNRLG